MKEFIFISDFDNTISERDFYWLVIDHYIGQRGVDYYKEWKKSNKIGTEFLNTIFSWHTFTDEAHIEALDRVHMDVDLEGVETFVRDHGGDFHILSAGFSYYIEYALAKRGLGHLHVITNEGSFRKGQFLMEPDQTSPYYSDVYGINKEAVALHYKAQTKKLYFAGDSEPDFWAAQHADVIFAKEELARILDGKGIPYIAYRNFADILEALKHGV